jgi:hypothetical protein
MGTAKTAWPHRAADTDPGLEGDALGGEIVRAIRQMPDSDPPVTLVPAVMMSIKSRRLPLRIRLIRWVRSPHSVTFTPLRLAPAVAIGLIFCILWAFYGAGRQTRDLAATNDGTPVVLALHLPHARSVAVIGTFNGWQPQTCERTTVNGSSHWTVTLRLPSGRYEYAFWVDGEKVVPDPAAALYGDDGFGSTNAILLVGNGDGNSA